MDSWNTLCSLQWTSNWAFHRQQGWFGFFFDARSTRGEPWGNWGNAVTMRTAFLLGHFLCLTIGNNHPLHTRLFNPVVYTQDAYSSKEEIVFPVQLARGRRACPENTNTAVTPTVQGLYAYEQKVTRAQPPEAATPWDPSDPLGSVFQSCAKSTWLLVEKFLSKTGSPPSGSWLPAPFCCPLLAWKGGGMSREFLYD